ncbi:MAG TPA: BMC domain-containing protein [Thermoanaerobaculales bacterium]|nr:BMC domain-containing protein [Thermoanaerobaculales bacterium]HQP45111.1 BMC domain-containing protein [Thermoanaerobaculales bacterium]
MIEPALALIDFGSVAAGIEAADAMAKRAQIDVLRAGTVQPGRYLVLVGGAVADVEESLAAGRAVGGTAVLDHVFLPHVHPEVVAAIGGGRVPGLEDALGVVETATAAAVIHAADAGVKGADVRLVEIRLADGLGGKGIVLFSGVVADVQTAVELGGAALERPEQLVRSVVIPRLHPSMWKNISDATRFSARVLERL